LQQVFTSVCEVSALPALAPAADKVACLLYNPCCSRKAREQKAYAKQVQAEKVKERAQEKKRQIQQVQQLRKQREKSVSYQRHGWRRSGAVSAAFSCYRCIVAACQAVVHKLHMQDIA
jgi:ADP-ribosylglycohydrolase